jgi:hypothetical protein
VSAGFLVAIGQAWDDERRMSNGGREGKIPSSRRREEAGCWMVRFAHPSIAIWFVRFVHSLLKLI